MKPQRCSCGWEGQSWIGHRGALSRRHGNIDQHVNLTDANDDGAIPFPRHSVMRERATTKGRHHRQEEGTMKTRDVVQALDDLLSQSDGHHSAILSIGLVSEIRGEIERLRVENVKLRAGWPVPPKDGAS